ncbi:MAG TPA: YqhA family protein [Polyangia bacterium]|nr:YqhA family protein [Polyangia bacterium]
MFEQLLKIRYIVLVIVVLAVLHAVAFLVLGAKVAVRAYALVLTRGGGGVEQARPGLELLHSLDYMFVAIVFIVLALGFAKLFLAGPKTTEAMSLPTWLRIDSIAELKVLLWETILLTLVISALSELTTGLFERLDWSALITPTAIFALAFSLYLVKKK